MPEYYAEDLNYWKTGTSNPDTIMQNAKSEIESINGVINGEAFMKVGERSVYMLTFTIGDDLFKAAWPVLESRTGNLLAARRQAATMLYHDVKAKVVMAKVMGARVAFMPFLVLPSGRGAAEATNRELADGLREITTILLPGSV